MLASRSFLGCVVIGQDINVDGRPPPVDDTHIALTSYVKLS
jgi:hypothetical protein